MEGTSSEQPWEIHKDLFEAPVWAAVNLEPVALQEQQEAAHGASAGNNLLTIPPTLRVKFLDVEPSLDLTSHTRFTLPTPFQVNEDAGEATGSERDDIWLWTAEQKSSHPEPQKQTWEVFNDTGFHNGTPFLSEAEPLEWNAALQRETASGIKPKAFHDEPNVVTQEAGIKALSFLGLGLDSMLFQLDGRTCKTRVFGLTTSGLSHELFLDVGQYFVTVGNDFSALEAFEASVRADSGASVTKIAAAESVTTIAAQVRRHLVNGFQNQRSILQLQSLFERPAQLMQGLRELTASLSKQDRDEDILDIVFRAAQERESCRAWAKPVILAILERISKPWLETLSDFIGLQRPRVSSKKIMKRLISATKEFAEISKNVLGKSMPSFLDETEAQLVFETHETLALLQKEQNLLFHHDAYKDTTLEWAFTWADIERLQRKASDYENRVQNLALDAGRGKSDQVGVQGSEERQRAPFDPFGLPEEQIPKTLAESNQLFTGLRRGYLSSPDPLQVAVSGVLSKCSDQNDDLLTPPVSPLPSLSFRPLLATQARLVSRRLLRTLFITHQLTRHLALQHAFYLFGSGIFTTRLVQALLSTDLGATESQRKLRRTTARVDEAATAGSSGLSLRLGTRSSWPPASSELRLALDGILMEVCHVIFPLAGRGDFEIGAPATISDTEDPTDRLSFAIRPLSNDSPAALEAIMDRNSIAAIDFLQVSYQPPQLVDAVITPKLLDSYDKCFAFLLRLSRVLWVATQKKKAITPEDEVCSQRLGIEVHGFVEVVAGHCLTAINALWAQFIARVKAIEMQVTDGDTPKHAPSTSTDIVDEKLGPGSVPSLHRLRQLHEEVLRDISSALLLRQRQKRARAALDAALQMVLDIARENAGSATALSAFRTRVVAFLDECAQLRTREQGQGALGIAGAESLMERLELAGWNQASAWWRPSAKG